MIARNDSEPGSVNSVQDSETDYVADDSDLDVNMPKVIKLEVAKPDLQSFRGLFRALNVKHYRSFQDSGSLGCEEIPTKKPRVVKLEVKRFADGGLEVTKKLVESEETDDIEDSPAEESVTYVLPERDPIYVWRPASSSDDSSNSGTIENSPIIDNVRGKNCVMCAKTTHENLPFCSQCYSKRKNTYSTRRRCKNLKSHRSEISHLSRLHKNVPPNLRCKNSIESMDTSENTPGASKKTFDICNESPLQKCITCNIRPKNGIFLHSTSGHMCFCYECAVEYWNKSKRCSWCNGIIRGVIKAHIM